MGLKNFLLFSIDYSVTCFVLMILGLFLLIPLVNFIIFNNLYKQIQKLLTYNDDLIKTMWEQHKK